jgi:predicted aspartyl protease
MSTGMVNAHCEAIIPLSVQDANGQGHMIDAVTDTGYTGCLTLPPTLIAALGLTWKGYGIVCCFAPQRRHVRWSYHTQGR